MGRFPPNKTRLLRVPRRVICTGRMRSTTSERGQTQKVPPPKILKTPNFGGRFEVDLAIILCIVCHNTLCQNVQENVGQSTGGSRKVNKWLCYRRGTARRACQKKFCNYKISLLCGIICVILSLAVFTQYRSVTDTPTQTDGQIHADRMYCA